jgi:DNA-binding IclR family transcriptional regulator
MEVELAAKRGWADGPEELFRGINGLAVPIFAADQTLAGCLTIVDSIDFLPSPPGQPLLQAVLAARDRISEQLGVGLEQQAIA